MSARVLVVCTGNICRSPLAEGLLQVGLAGLPVAVSSAGTHALDGGAATAPTVELGRRLADLDLSRHEARFLTESLLEDADLVLTMTSEHSVAVLSLAPALAKRTFTIRELEHLLGLGELGRAEAEAGAAATPAVRVRALAEQLSRRRSEAGVRDADLDVADPYGRGAAAYESSGRQISSSVSAVVGALRGVLA